MQKKAPAWAFSKKDTKIPIEVAYSELFCKNFCNLNLLYMFFQFLNLYRSSFMLISWVFISLCTTNYKTLWYTYILWQGQKKSGRN